jgi:predicted DNA-binding protein
MAKETQKDGKVAVSFWIEKDIADKLDYLAEQGGITKSKLLSNIVEVVVHDMMIVDKLGIIKLGRFYYELREGIKNKTTKYKDKKIMSDIMEDKKEEK